ncbi:MAG: MFS transporter [Nitrososphaerota archaeon]|nr:MFS transporter [Nitrososphaerota archaeon]MDG6943161.1 MFS transporter [Nitrososphaerota archaeon]MDG6950961.1 MFS transporter [Nitrososphaerota archaeon]
MSGSAGLRGFFRLPRNAWILTATSALWSIGSAMPSPYQSVYFASLGASPISIGLLVAYGTGLTMFALLMGGYIADVWGRRRVIILFSWVSVASAFVYFFIGSYMMIIIPLSLASVASFYTPAFNSVMIDSIEPDDRIRGFAVFSAINTTPSIFAPTIAGILIDRLGVTPGLRLCYLTSGLFGVLGVGIRSLKLKETYLADSPPTKSPFSHLRDSFVEGVRAVRGSGTVVKRLLLYVTLAGIGTGLTSPYVSIYVVNYLGLNALSYSIVVDLAGATTVILLLTVVFLIKRLGSKKSILLASVAAPLSNVMFTQAKTMDELLEWGVTGAVSTALQSPSLSTMQAEAIELRHRGKVLAMFSILPTMVSLPSQVIAGYIYSVGSPVFPFALSIVPFTIAALVLYTIR